MQNGKQVSLSFLLMSFAATGTIWWSILARGLGRAIKNYLVKLHAPTSLLGKFLLRCQKKIPTDTRMFMATLYSCRKAVNLSLTRISKL